MLRRSGSLQFECFVEGCKALRKRGASDAECAFDNARFAANIAREVESPGCPLRKARITSKALLQKVRRSCGIWSVSGRASGCLHSSGVIFKTR